MKTPIAPTQSAQSCHQLPPGFFLFQKPENVNKSKHSQSLTFLYIFSEHFEYQLLAQEKMVKPPITKTCKLIQFLAFLQHFFDSFFSLSNPKNVYRNLQFGLKHPFQLPVKNTQNGYKKLTNSKEEPRPWLRRASNIMRHCYKSRYQRCQSPVHISLYSHQPQTLYICAILDQ